MMEQNDFCPLLEATELLGNTKAHDALLQMQSVYQQRLYFVAFIGQYSAGKSCLLNSLLNRRLLPEGTTETTPLLTYIRYGEREEAKLHYLDGAVQILELAQVAQLAQQAENGRWDLDRLEFLEVYLHEDMLRSGMILLDTPGVNTLIERHEQLLESSLSMAASIVYVAGHAPSLVDADKLSMLTGAGFDVSFVRTHCDEIKEQEETLEQVRANDQPILAGCGIRPERCYYVSNRAESPLFAALDPLRRMLAEKGRCANTELESDLEELLSVQAERCETALEERRALLEQICAKNTESLEKQQSELLNRINRLQSRLKESEADMHERVEACRKTLRGDVRRQLETALQRSSEHIESSAAVVDEAGMAALLHREAVAFSGSAYQLINASLDPLVQKVNGELSAEEIDLDNFALPQADNYRELQAEQDEQATRLRGQLAAIQESQSELTRALSAKAGSPEYFQMQQELQELESALADIQRERNDLPPYVPQMVVEEDGRVQPSQIARSIGAAADWALLLIPGTQIEAAITKLGDIPKIKNALGKLVGVAEKVGKAAKHGDTVKDILFSLKNISEHTRSSKRRVEIAGKAVSKLAKGAGAGVDALHSAQRNNDASILDLLTIEHWAGKLGEQFDRPPHLVVDREYEAQYKEAKKKIEDTYCETQRKAYQKKLEMGLFQNEAERLRAQEESLRIDQESVSRELEKREEKLRADARQDALKKWRRDCAVWYRDEVKRQLQDVIEGYIEGFPSRLEEYQRQRLQTVREALEQERTAYDSLKNTPEDETALELRRVNDLLEEIHHVFHR